MLGIRCWTMASVRCTRELTMPLTVLIVLNMHLHNVFWIASIPMPIYSSIPTLPLICVYYDILIT